MEVQNSRLKKQLNRCKQMIQELKTDLNYKEKQLISIQAQRDKYFLEVQAARHTVNQFNNYILKHDNQIRQQQSKKHDKQSTKNKKIQYQLQNQKFINQKLRQEIEEKNAAINELKNRLKEFARKYNQPSMIINIGQARNQMQQNYDKLLTLTNKYNKISTQMQNVSAQNRILRKLAGVSQNYGFDLEQIKIAQKQQIDDYRLQVRYLEKQVQQLEGQRTELRNRLRQQSNLYSGKPGQHRYKDLSPQQLMKLDEYVIILKQGRLQTDINKSKRQLQNEIMRLKAQIEILQNNLIRPIQAQNLDKEQFRHYQQQLKMIITQLINNRAQIPKKTQYILEKYQVPKEENFGKYSPPIPLPIAANNWSSIIDGYSYTFNGKIGVNMDHLSSEYGFDITQAKYEIAALQLQNIESMKIIEQKDRLFHQMNSELRRVSDKYKNCLLLQDELFKRHTYERQKFKQEQRKMERQKREMQLYNNQLIGKLTSYQRRGQIQENQMQKRLAQAQMMKLRYQKQNKFLLKQKQQYQQHSKLNLKRYKQRQEIMKQKQIRFRQWRQKLTVQLQLLFQQSKVSVPSQQYQIIRTKLSKLSDKFANAICRQGQLRKKLSLLQTYQFQYAQKNQQILILSQENMNLQLQLKMVSRRLEVLDPVYGRCQQLFQRICQTMKRRNLSPLSYFQAFNLDKNSNLSKSQFKNAITNIEIQINQQQIDILFEFFDLDGSGTISYKQFLRKLRREGVNVRTKQQQAIYRLYMGIRQSGYTIKKAFEAIDKNRNGFISQHEMQGAFIEIGISYDKHVIQTIFRISGSTQHKMSYHQFQNLFKNVVKNAQVQDRILFKTSLDWKVELLVCIEQTAAAQGLTLIQVFETLDQDNSRSLTIDEFQSCFSKMRVGITKGKLQELFKTLDKNKNGKINYDQFYRKVREAKRQKQKVQRLLYVERRAQQLRGKQQKQEYRGYEPTNRKIQLEMKNSMLQVKLKSITQNIQNLAKQLAIKEQEVKDLQKQKQQDRIQYQKLNQVYFVKIQEIEQLRQRTVKCISKQKSQILITKDKKMILQYTTTQSAFQVYRNLYQYTITKLKAERQSTQRAQMRYRQAQAQCKQIQKRHPYQQIEVKELKKKYLISKEKQGQIGLHYERLLDQFKYYKKQNILYQNQIKIKQSQIIDVYKAYRDRITIYLKQIEQLTSYSLPTVSITKIQQLSFKMRQISMMKSTLQQSNKKLRQKNYQLQVRNDFLESHKSLIQKLQYDLRKNPKSDKQLSNQLINLSTKLSEYKLIQLKAKRQSAMLKQKEEYYTRLNYTLHQSIRQMEQQLANWQIKHSKREQFWRNRVSQQVKQIDRIKQQCQQSKKLQNNANIFLTNRITQFQKQKNSAIEKQMFSRSYFKDGDQIYQLKNQIGQKYFSKIEQLQINLKQKDKQIQILKNQIVRIDPSSLNHIIKLNQNQTGKKNKQIKINRVSSNIQKQTNIYEKSKWQQQKYNVYKLQNEKMMLVAQHSIQILQNMINQKNKQIQLKQNTIKQLKQHSKKIKQEDAQQINRLNQIITKMNLEQIRTIKQSHSSYKPLTIQNKALKQYTTIIKEQEQKIANLQRLIKKSPKHDKNIKTSELHIVQNRQDLKKFKQQIQKYKRTIETSSKLLKKKQEENREKDKIIIELKDKIVKDNQQHKKQQINVFLFNPDKKFVIKHKCKLEQNLNIITEGIINNNQTQQRQQKIKLVNSQLQNQIQIQMNSKYFIILINIFKWFS